MGRAINWNLGLALIRSGSLTVPQIARKLKCSTMTVYAKRLHMMDQREERILGDPWGGIKAPLEFCDRGGIKAPLEFCDRGRFEGFKRYFSQRPGHFKDIYGVEYSDRAAWEAFYNEKPESQDS
jgi:hypothetical protein